MVALAGRALFFHAEPAASAELAVEAKRYITQSVSQTFNCSGGGLARGSEASDGVDAARGRCRGALEPGGGVPKLVCWWHCGRQRRRCAPSGVLIEPTC
jgi:hypothetical protein